MRTTGALGGSGPGAFLALGNAASALVWTTLDLQGAGYWLDTAGDLEVGIPVAGNTTWQTVLATIRVTTGGTLAVYCQMGRAALGNTGVAQWDDIRLTRQSPQVAIGGWRGSVVIDDGFTFYVPDTTTVKVGTQSTPSHLTKTIRIPSHFFVPVQDITKWSFSPSGVGLSVTGATHFLQAPVYLPIGVTITNIRARIKRNATGDACIVALDKATGDTTFTTLATISPGASASFQTLTTALSEVVGSFPYVINLQMFASVTSGTSGDAVCCWCELDYQMASYDKGI